MNIHLLDPIVVVPGHRFLQQKDQSYDRSPNNQDLQERLPSRRSSDVLYIVPHTLRQPFRDIEYTYGPVESQSLHIAL